MEKIQTIKRKRPTVLKVTARRQNPSEKEIPPPYSAEGEKSPSNVIFGY